jgi:AcrR family transcriptional regulator
MKKSIAQRAQQERQTIVEGVHDQKRERILDVARELFFRQGFAGTTMADIVEQLGVTKPYVYYYFPSKNDLFETLCWQASHACLTAMHFDKDDPRTAVEKLHEGLHRFAAANIVHFKAGTFFYRESGVLRAPLQRKLRTLARRFYDELCELLEQGRQDGELDFDNTKLTALAIGSIAGFMYTWYRPDGRIGPEDMVGQLQNILLKIAGAKVPAAKRKGAGTKN